MSVKVSVEGWLLVDGHVEYRYSPYAHLPHQWPEDPHVVKSAGEEYTILEKKNGS